MSEQFLKQDAFLTYSLRFHRSNTLRTIRIQIGKNNWDLETCRKCKMFLVFPFQRLKSLFDTFPKFTLEEFQFFNQKKNPDGYMVRNWQLQQQERRENYKKSFIVLSVMLTILPGSSKCHFPSRLAHPVVSFYAGLYASFTLLTPSC